VSKTKLPISTKLHQLQRNLQNISSLPIRHGSRVLLKACTQVELNSLVKALNKAEEPVPRMLVESGALLLEEYPTSAIHEAISRYFDRATGQYNVAVTGDLMRPLLAMGTADRSLANGVVQPDGQFEVATIPPRNCPNIVIEVAKMQSLAALHRKSLRYLNESSNVLVVIAIKVYHNLAMLALVYHRSADGSTPVHAPTTAVSFGYSPPMSTRTAANAFRTTGRRVSGYVEGQAPLIPCDHAGIPQYQLRVDHRLALATNDAGGEVAPEHQDAPDLVFELFDARRSLPL
jgi:hypothetical protein